MSWGPLHTWAKSHDLVLVRTLDSHPKAVQWVLRKLLYVVIGPQAWCEVRMDHVARPLHILLVEKKGRIWFNIICLKFYQFERTTWWCLFVLKSILDSIMEYSLPSVVTYFMLGKILKKSCSPGICVKPTSWRWAWRKFWGPWNLIHSPPCRTPCRCFIHEVFFGHLGLHLCVWSELGRSPPFRPMRALRL